MKPWVRTKQAGWSGTFFLVSMTYVTIYPTWRSLFRRARIQRELSNTEMVKINHAEVTVDIGDDELVGWLKENATSRVDLRLKTNVLFGTTAMGEIDRLVEAVFASAKDAVKFSLIFPSESPQGRSQPD